MLVSEDGCIMEATNARTVRGYHHRRLLGIARVGRWILPSKSPSSMEHTSITQQTNEHTATSVRSTPGWESGTRRTLSHKRFTSASVNCLHWLSWAIHPSTSCSMVDLRL
jgi:hypothetical protein